MGNAVTAIRALIVAAETSAAGRIEDVNTQTGQARPNITYQVIGTKRPYSNEGACGLAFATIQITCMADDPKSVKQLTDAVRIAINGFTGMAGSGDGSVWVQSIFVIDELDAPQAPSPGKESPIRGKVLLAKVAFNE